MNKISTILIILICLLATGCDSETIQNDNNDDDSDRLLTVTFNSQVRGKVGLEVYLPPGWDKNLVDGYPVIFFLHGQGGHQFSFFNDVDYQQLDGWINQQDLPPFVVVAIESYFVGNEEQQWSTQLNETMLTSEAPGELRAFVQENFNAGLTPNKVSIHGQSRGARGALHYAFKFPESFASAMSNAFVSDYALHEEQQNALNNIDRINQSGIKIRMVIGTEDNWVLEQGRQASYIMHDYLISLGIDHEFEILTGAGHQLNSMWNTATQNGMENGLYEMKLHANAWQE